MSAAPAWSGEVADAREGQTVGVVVQAQLRPAARPGLDVGAHDAGLALDRPHEPCRTRGVALGGVGEEVGEVEVKGLFHRAGRHRRRESGQGCPF